MIPAILDQGRSKDVALVTAASIGQAIGAGLAAFATRDIFGALQNSSPAPKTALAVLMLAWLLIALLRIVNRTIAERLGQDFAASLRHALFRHLSNMNQSDIAGRRMGAMGLRFVGDLSAARLWVGLGLTQLYSATVVLPGAIIALYWLNISLATSALWPILFTVVVMLAVARQIAPLHSNLRSKRASIATSMMERVAVAANLNVLGRLPMETTRLEKDNKQLKSVAVARARTVACLRAVPEIGLAVAGISVMATAFLVSAPAAEVAGALAVLSILFLPVRDLAGVWDRRCAWMIARQKCEIVFAKPSHPRGERARSGAAIVKFDQVTYRGLNLDFSIDAGEKVLISGGPGSGKSSILGLAIGLNIAETGTVSFGDRTLRPVSAIIGSQAPILQGSLRRALCLGVEPRPSDNEILSVLGKYGLEALVQRLEGLDGRVGEAGRNLSSSERTGVLLARAEFTRPELIVLDAADIVLDPATVEAIGRLLDLTEATVLIACDTGHFDRFADRHLRIEQGQLIPHF
ncbi:ABC transporter ATP-binding protein [Coralliovum pocilloporae]|uniref:ABC transporter ATP-binding protein n=1 Tax=Coralliovum pocilloporae TaxID=3066369 RepID=UPI00330764C9